MTEMVDARVKRGFFEYLEAHPEERFWQALRNWSGFGFILSSTGMPGDRPLDTFYYKDIPPPRPGEPHPFRMVARHVEAMQHDGSTKSAEAIEKWSGGFCTDYWEANVGGQRVVVRAIQGESEAHAGDWIVKEGDRFFAVSAKEFAAHYEGASE